MKNVLRKRSLQIVCLFLIGLFYGYKTSSNSEKETPPFNLVAEQFIQHKFTKKKLLPYKDELVVTINIEDRDGLFRNSTYILRMSIWRQKDYFTKEHSKDSIFEFTDVNTVFYNTKNEYKRLFPKQFKRTVGSIKKKTQKKSHITIPYLISRFILII